MKIRILASLMAGWLAMSANAQMLETRAVASLEHLKTLEGGALGAVDLLGFHAPGDGGGGRFLWVPGGGGAVDGVLAVQGAGAQGRWVRDLAGGPLNVRWFGAKGDGVSDDAPAIQKAIDTIANKGAANLPGTLYFPPGNYHVHKTLVVSKGPLTLLGDKAQTSRLFYAGKEYEDLIHFALKDDNKQRNVKVFDLGFNGGGRARYCIFGEYFTRGCQIQRCVIRGGVGLIKLVGCWYADVSYNEIRSVAPTPRHLTPEQLAEVHGPDSAPVFFSGGGASSFDRNAFFDLGLASEMPAATARAIFISSAGSSFSNNSVENVWNKKEANTNDIPEVALEIRGTVGVRDLYMEKVAAKRVLIHADRANIDGALIYHAKAATLFLAAGPQDLVVRNSFIRRVMGDYLFRIADPQQARGSGANVAFENCSILTGDRTGAGKRAGELVYDHRATGFAPLGMSDSDGSGRSEPALNRPAIVDGYQVRFGKDEHGPLVEVGGGIFLSEQGKVVRSKELQVLDGVEIAAPDHQQRLNETQVLACRPQILRFAAKPAARVGKWYRVYIGKAGQPYLEVFDSAPGDGGGGNWLVEFKLAPGDQFAEETRNPALGQ